MLPPGAFSLAGLIPQNTQASSVACQSCSQDQTSSSLIGRSISATSHSSIPLTALNSCYRLTPQGLLSSLIADRPTCIFLLQLLMRLPLGSVQRPNKISPTFHAAFVKIKANSSTLALATHQDRGSKCQCWKLSTPTELLRTSAM